MSELRTATVDDLAEIMALENASFPTDAWSEHLMRDELASEHTQYVVLQDGGQIVGYAGLRLLSGDPNSDVQTIAIATDRRGRGDGRRLLRELLRRAAAGKARHVFLDVRDDNTVAIALYVAEGFVEIGRRPRYYQPDDVDAIAMRLDLTTAVKENLA